MPWYADSSSWLWVILLGASLTAAVIDLRSRRIPNALTGPLLLAGLAWGILCTTGAIRPSSAAVSSGVGDSVLGALVAGFPFFVLWVAMGAGAGDAKLMMAIGAWVGANAALLLLACTGVAGGVFAVAWALSEGRLGAVVAGLPRAAVDLAFLARGPGRHAMRLEVVRAAAVGQSSVDRDAAPRRRRKLPYAPAIFAGTCVAALRVFLA